MESSDHDEGLARARSTLPDLIDDYRAQRTAWRAQERSLAQMRADVTAAAELEAREIVARTRADVREILVKSRRDLLIIAAQVQAATEDGAPASSATDPTSVPRDDLGAAHRALASARRDIRHVLDDVRPDLEALSSEAAALRAGLRHGAPVEPAPPQAIQITRTPSAIDEPAVSLGRARPMHAYAFGRFVAAFVVVGLAITVVTMWWLRRGATEDASVLSPSLPVAEVTPSAPAASGAMPLPAESMEIPPALTVHLDVRRVAWLRTTIDGEVTSARLYRAGETQQIDATRDVSIRAGDAGAVWVSLNGAAAMPLGRDGQVITRVFALGERTTSPPEPRSGAADGGATASDKGWDNVQVQLPTPRPDLNVPDAPPSTASAPDVPTATQTESDAPPLVSLPPPLPEPTISPRAPVAEPTVSEQLLGPTERWLAAYYRRDRAGMTALSSPQLSVSDARTERDRLPPGLAGIRRTLDNVKVQVFGENAILTARMTERTEDLATGRTMQSAAFISLVWTRRGDAWQLDDVRVVPEAKVAGAVR